MVVTTGARWRDATPATRQSYITGITDGIHMAATFQRAGVNPDPVGQCIQRMSDDQLARLVADQLDVDSIEGDERVVPFYVWDALVSICRGG